MAAQAQPLLTALPEHFASSRQSCYLYAASELVKTFGSNLAYEQALGEIAVLGPNLDTRISIFSAHQTSLSLDPLHLSRCGR